MTYLDQATTELFLFFFTLIVIIFLTSIAMELAVKYFRKFFRAGKVGKDENI